MNMLSSTSLLAALALVAAVQASVAAPLAADLAAVQTKLASHAQLNVSGDQAYFMPADAAQPRQYEHFTLWFDRPTQRLRMSYSRFGSVTAPRVDIEAWGTLDCLNLLRADRSPPGMIQAKSQTCVKLDPLYSMLSEGTPIASAPVVVLSGMIRDTLLPHTADQPHRMMTLDHQGNHSAITMAYDNIANDVGHYWLNPRNDAIDKVDGTGQGYRLRASYQWSSAAPTDADFAYMPDPELIALAAVAQDPKTSHAKLEELAHHGSKAAELQLAFSDQSAMLMFYGPPHGHPELTEQGWTALDALAKKGFGSGYLAQARWLGRSASEDLPTQFKNWPSEKRKQHARELFWMAAKACDAQALQDLPRALSLGDELFEPNPLKLTEFEPIQKHCLDVLTPTELKTAAAKVADPWP